jgi:uncharacterized protein YdaU (DUF1376 family)
MKFFKFYMGDYLRDTAHLSMAEHGAYFLMLQNYYATQKPLPSGDALYRMLRAQTKPEKEAIDSIVKQFWVRSAEGITNARADKEIESAAVQADKNRIIARDREAAKRLTDAQKILSINRESSFNGSFNGSFPLRSTTSEPNHSHSHSHSHSQKVSQKTVPGEEGVTTTLLREAK